MYSQEKKQGKKQEEGRVFRCRRVIGLHVAQGFDMLCMTRRFSACPHCPTFNALDFFYFWVFKVLWKDYNP